MAMASEYVRCTVRCGAYRIKDVGLPGAVLAEANSGNNKARKQIVEKFIQHIKELGIINGSDDADKIDYQSLDISY